MPLDAFVLALGSAFLHALWNLILGRERDPEAATAVALVTSVVLFAPAAVWHFDADAGVLSLSITVVALPCPAVACARRVGVLGQLHARALGGAYCGNCGGESPSKSQAGSQSVGLRYLAHDYSIIGSLVLCGLVRRIRGS